jgi:hypothetical protein
VDIFRDFKFLFKEKLDEENEDVNMWFMNFFILVKKN